MSKTDAEILAELRHDYRPYDTLPSFDEGFASYQCGEYRNPYPSTRDAQAWESRP